MTNTGGFDVMLQFTQEVVHDIFVRVLNESLVTNLHLKSPISRLIDEPLPPTQVKAWWDKPELELDDDDSISLSVDVTGGARQLLTQRNLEVDGSVSIKRKALLATDEMGELYIHLEAPKLLDLHMSKLKVTYPGSTWPPLLSAIDPTRETTVLRPLLTKTLLEPLSQLPLSYKVKSLPLRFPVSDTFNSRTPTTMSSEWHIPVTMASVHIVKTKQADAVAIGLSLTNNRCDPQQMTIAFPKEAKSNAALTLPSMGMNNIIGQLQRRGVLEGVIPSASSGEAPVNWQWEVLSVHCHEGYISLTGNFRRNTTLTHVTADLECSLDRDGTLVIVLRSTNTDTLTTKTVVDSWYEVLRMILRARAKDQQDDKNEDWHKLYQCFTIVGTQIEVETPAEDIIIEEGSFTVLYHVPQTMDFQAEIPWLKPQVVVTEPHIPVQTAKGAPVSMQMQAQITTQSFPPYDYVWTTDLSEEPTPDRGPSMTVNGYPTTIGTGSQVYTQVHVKVIDAFGQTAEAKVPAMYQPWEQQQVLKKVSKIGSGVGGQEGSESQMVMLPPPSPPPVHSPKNHWRSVGCLLLLAVIIIIGYAFWQGVRSNSSTGSTPVPTPAAVQRTLTSQQSQSQTVNATGQGTTPGTQARGTLTVNNFDPKSTITFRAGTTFSNTFPTPIQMVLDADVNVSPPPPGVFYSRADVPAHVIPVGTIGNIPKEENPATGFKYVINDSSGYIVEIINNFPFTGGTDPQTSTVVQQSDIDTAANSLTASTRQNAVADLNSQLQSNEHLVGDPQCTSNTTSDHSAGDQATTVTVTVQTSCTATAST
jgi:hypothetical protein